MKKVLAVALLIIVALGVAGMFFIEKEKENREKEIEVILQTYISEVEEDGYLKPITQKKIAIDLRKAFPRSEILVKGTKNDEFFDDEVFIYAKVAGRIIGIVEILVIGEKQAFG